MKKRVILSFVFIVFVILAIITILYTIDFIIKQSDLSTAYFYTSKALTGEKFSSFQDYINYQNNGGEFINSTSESIVVACVFLVFELLSLVCAIFSFIRFFRSKEQIKNLK